ncbi:Taurine catabolism dioxygenase TauD/TfdA [Rhodopirellula sp. SWK7]|nr:Taurine catabolism dioxygenase TauD/TfdA [Rhodopirellula sp. SWK7]
MSIDYAPTVTQHIAGHPTPVQCSQLTSEFGVEITGVDLTQMSQESMQPFLKRFLLDHQVLLFRDQLLDETQQVRLAQSLGPCRKMWQIDHYVSDNEFVQYLSNVDRQGRFVGSHPDPHSTCWHVDGSHTHVPSKATILNALQVPPNSGHTMFASLYQIYDSLDDETKIQLAKHEAEHHIEFRRARRNGRLPWQWSLAKHRGASLTSQLKWWMSTIKRRWQDGGVFHPIVRHHTETGRPVLFIGDHAWRVRGKFLPLGIKLMQQINSIEIDPLAIYTHHWAKGDLLIWDNTSVLHRAGEYDLHNEARVLRRCVVEGV